MCSIVLPDCAQCDIVLVEGAGSASEVNLRANDIANMGFARAADAPVVLIGDIDRGGVIASLCGTQAVIDPEDGKLIVGFIVNKMRGDPTLVRNGHEFRGRAHRLGAARAGAVFSRRASAAGGGCAGAGGLARRSNGHDRPTRAHCGAGPAAYRQFRRSRSAAARTLCRADAAAPRRAAAGRY